MNTAELEQLRKEIAAEHAADIAFAHEHETSFVESKSDRTGKVTMRQWAYERGNRKCLMTRFVDEPKKGWSVAIKTGDRTEELERHKSQHQALLGVADWLRSATVPIAS